MQKTSAGEGAGAGVWGTGALASPVIHMFGEGSFAFAACFSPFLFGVFPPLALLSDEHGQVEKKNANGFAITTFSSC